MVIPAGCTVSIDGNINATNSVTLEIYGQLYFADSGDKLDLSSTSSKINIYSGGSISGASNSNQIKIGSGGAEWSGPGTASGPFEISNGSNTLPIELVQFKATCESNGILITWTTASELHNDYFLIERSESGLDWVSIAKVDGSGTIKSIKKYSYTDDDLVAYQTSYYRLKQIDFDKSSTVSNLISVNCEANFGNEMKIFPNPASSEINIQFKVNRNMTGSVKLTDAYGKLVFEEKTELTKGISTLNFPVKVACGMYQLEFSSENLKLPNQKLIILNH